MRALLLGGLAAIALAACGGTQVQTTSAKVPVPSGQSASFDDVEIDQATQTVYAADRANSGVDVFDVSGAHPAFETTIRLPDVPNGLAIDSARGRVYAGTAGGAVAVIDATTHTVVSEVTTPAKSIDLLDFAPLPDLLLAGSGAGGTLLTIDPTSGRLIATATVGKPVEQPRYDPASGLVYASVPDLDALVVIDPRTGVVMKTLQLGGCIPRGLAIRSSTGTAVISCHKSVMSYDLATGAKTSLGQRAGGGDIVQYFAGTDRFFVVAQHSPLPAVIGMFGGNPVNSLGAVNLDGGGSAVVYDDRNDTLYTTNESAGQAGLMGFRMDGTVPVPIWQTAMYVGVPALLFVLIAGLLWWWLGRHADPIHRKRPEARPAA